MSMRDPVEEFCMLRIWPLGRGWDLPLSGSLDGIRLIEVEGLECEVSITFVGFSSKLLLTHVSCGDAVAPVDKAVRAAEVFPCPYTSGEHSRRSLIVCEPWQNRACLSQG